MSRKIIYKCRLELLVSNSQREYIQREAKRLDLTMNQFIRNLIDDSNKNK